MLPDTSVELSPEQLEQLHTAQTVIPKLKEQIRRAKLAGIDITGLDAQLAQVEKDLGNLMRVYGRKNSNRAGAS